MIAPFGRRCLALGLCALAAAPAAAGAHGEGSPLIRGVVEGIEPRVEGVTFRPVRGPVAQVAVTNHSPEPLEVLSIDGEAFLRIGPRGVEGNVTSPAWWESGNPDGHGRPDVQPGSPPVWKLVSRRREWSYFEHRLHPREVEIPHDALRERRRTTLGSFTVPFRIGARTGEVRGRLEFRPVLGSVVPRVLTDPAPLPGVTVAALPGLLPGLLLQNSSKRTVRVMGGDGEPFARVGRRGVELNLRSPIAAETLRLRGEQPKVPVDPRARPVWRRMQAQPSLTWIEPRARYAPEQPPDEIAESPKPVSLRTWEIPLAAGARRVTVRGSTDWVPTDAAGRPSRGSGGGARGTDHDLVMLIPLLGAGLLLGGRLVSQSVLSRRNRAV